MVSKNIGRTEKSPINAIIIGIISALLLIEPLIIWKPIYSAAINTKVFFAGFLLATGFILAAVDIMRNPVRLLTSRNRVLLPVCIFWGYVLLHILFHPDKLLNLRDSFLWILYPFLAFSLFIYRKDIKTLYVITGIIQIAALLVSLHGIFQYYGYEISYLKWKGVPPHLKVMGTMGNPNYLAEYLLPLIPATLVWSWKAYPRTWMQAAGYIQVFLTLYCFWLTGSAEVWVVLPLCLLATIIVSLLLFKGYWKDICSIKNLPGLSWKKVLIIPIILAVLFLGILGAHSSENWDYLKGQPANTFILSAYMDRFMVWEVADQMIVKKPLWGWGAGGFRVNYLQELAEFLRNPENEAFVTSANSTKGSNANQAHNDYLQMAVDWGLMGIFLFMGMMVYLVGRGMAAIHRSRETDKRILMAGTLLGILFLLFDSLVNFPLYIPSPSMNFWALIGILLLLIESVSEQAETENKSCYSPKYAWIVKGLMLILVIFMGVLVINNHNRLKANLSYKQGMKSAAMGKKQDADILFQRALLYDPAMGEAYLQRAVYLSDSRQTGLAVQNAFKAFQFGTDDVERYVVLAQAINKNGEPQRAVEILNTANIIYPRYSLPYQMKAMIYSQQWYHPELAVKEWESFLASGVSDSEKEMAIAEIARLKKDNK
jgi:O-antigen ligase